MIGAKTIDSFTRLPKQPPSFNVDVVLDRIINGDERYFKDISDYTQTSVKNIRAARQFHAKMKEMLDAKMIQTCKEIGALIVSDFNKGKRYAGEFSMRVFLIINENKRLDLSYVLQAIEDLNFTDIPHKDAIWLWKFMRVINTCNVLFSLFEATKMVTFLMLNDLAFLTHSWFRKVQDIMPYNDLKAFAKERQGDTRYMDTFVEKMCRNMSEIMPGHASQILCGAFYDRNIEDEDLKSLISARFKVDANEFLSQGSNALNVVFCDILTADSKDSIQGKGFWLWGNEEEDEEEEEQEEEEGEDAKVLNRQITILRQELAALQAEVTSTEKGKEEQDALDKLVERKRDIIARKEEELHRSQHERHSKARISEMKRIAKSRKPNVFEALNDPEATVEMKALLEYEQAKNDAALKAATMDINEKGEALIEAMNERNLTIAYNASREKKSVFLDIDFNKMMQGLMSEIVYRKVHELEREKQQIAYELGILQRQAMTTRRTIAYRTVKIIGGTLAILGLGILARGFFSNAQEIQHYSELMLTNARVQGVQAYYRFIDDMLNRNWYRTYVDPLIPTPSLIQNVNSLFITDLVRADSTEALPYLERVFTMANGLFSEQMIDTRSPALYNMTNIALKDIQNAIETRSFAMIDIAKDSAITLLRACQAVLGRVPPKDVVVTIVDALKSTFQQGLNAWQGQKTLDELSATKMFSYALSSKSEKAIEALQKSMNAVVEVGAAYILFTSLFVIKSAYTLSRITVLEGISVEAEFVRWGAEMMAAYYTQNQIMFRSLQEANAANAAANWEWWGGLFGGVGAILTLVLSFTPLGFATKVASQLSKVYSFIDRKKADSDARVRKNIEASKVESVQQLEQSKQLVPAKKKAVEKEFKPGDNPFYEESSDSENEN